MDKPEKTKRPPRRSRGSVPVAGDAEGALQRELREFVESRPGGWDHPEWLGLLDGLRERGHDTDDAEAIGRTLERERLARHLEGVQGMGPRRVEAVSARFGTLWSLRQASAEELASVPGMNRPLGEQVRRSLS